MGVRTNLHTFLSRRAVRGLEVPLRELVEEALSARPLVRPGVIETLSGDLRDAGTGADPAAAASRVRIATIEAETVSLRAAIAESMGAITAATAQLAALKREATAAVGEAREARARAAEAQTAAESASARVESLAARLAARPR